MAEKNPGVVAAIEAAGGSLRNLARLLSMSPSTISGWTRVPVDRALQIEAHPKLRVPRAILRPDLWGDEPKAGQRPSE